MTRNDIADWYPEETFLFADGLDDAIIGVDTETMRVVYSVKKCVKCLMKNGIEDLCFRNTKGLRRSHGRRQGKDRCIRDKRR
jgi:hypothetical protein